MLKFDRFVTPENNNSLELSEFGEVIFKAFWRGTLTNKSYSERVFLLRAPEMQPNVSVICDYSGS